VYWTYQEDEIPLPDWRRDEVVASLPPLDFRGGDQREADHDAYSRYYGLDLDVERPEVRYRLGYLRAAGFRVATHYYSQPGSRGTAFLFHGYFDHAGLYTRLISHCLDENLDVLIYDLPGHGLSSGEPTSIRSFAVYRHVLQDVLALCREHLVKPWVAVGQSTGGALLIDYLLMHGHTRETSEFASVTLLAPLIRPTGFVPGKVLHTALKPFVETWKRAFATNSNDPVFVKFQQEYDPLQSQVFAVDWVTALREWVSNIESAPPVRFELTVVQGEQDKTVAWRHNLRILRRKFSRVRVYQIPDGRHHLVNEAEPILEAVLDAVSRTFNSVLPSGKDNAL